MADWAQLGQAGEQQVAIKLCLSAKKVQKLEESVCQACHMTSVRWCQMECDLLTSSNRPKDSITMLHLLVLVVVGVAADADVYARTQAKAPQHNRNW